MNKEDNSKNNEEEILQIIPVESISENFFVEEQLSKMPSIYARGLLYIVTLLIVVFIIFSLLCKIDIIVESKAVAQPISHKLKIFSDRTGYIEKIFIKEGQEVKENEPLFLIRSKETLTYSSNIRINSLKLEQNSIELKSIESDLAYWKEQEENFLKEFNNSKILFNKRLISIDEHNTIKSKLERSRAEVNKLNSQKKIVMKDNMIIRQNLDMNKKILSVKNGPRSEDRNEDEKIFYNGKSGIISELYFRNPGEYVKESELLCTIIPSDSELYMNITIANKDIGFIESGMKINYKFDAFPYMDYGTIKGKVIRVSPSAVEDKNLGFIYHLDGTLDRRYFEIREKKYSIKPGMTALSEIITEKQSIFSLIFNKLK